MKTGFRVAARSRIALVISALCLVFLGTGSGAQDTFQFHGFVLADGTLWTDSPKPPDGDGGDLLLSELRLRLEANATSPSGVFFFRSKLDGAYDALDGSFEGKVHEAYAGLNQGPFDLRLGRQVMTWGVADLFSINDVFPKDWNSFFSGRPMEYMKRGVDAARLQASVSSLTVDFLAIPFFTPDILPSERRFYLYNPFAGFPNQGTLEPSTCLRNTQLALRLSREVAGWDASFYAYRGFWPTPSSEPSTRLPPKSVTWTYPELSTFGASGQRNLWGGVLSLEAGYYDSRQDRNGTNPFVPNSQWRLLAGFQRELLTDFTAGFQLYGEWMGQYGAYRTSIPKGAPSQDRFRGVTSVRLTRFLNYHALSLSLFAAYSPTDEDYFVQPEISYKMSDEMSLNSGANLFGGRRNTTFFGQLQKDDNLFVNLQWNF